MKLLPVSVHMQAVSLVTYKNKISVLDFTTSPCGFFLQSASPSLLLDSLKPFWSEPVNPGSVWDSLGTQ